MPARLPASAPCLLALAAPLCVIAACGDATPAATTVDAQQQLTQRALKRAMPSVVAVSVTRGTTTRTGTGTVLIRGQVTVDATLVGSPTSTTPAVLSVREASGEEHTASLEGTDRLSGLAVLRVSELEAVPPAKGGGAAALGQPVAALGYLSARRPAVRPGAVVAVGRSVRAAGNAEGGLLEATASLGGQAIGGPLVDAEGRVVALTTRTLVSLVPGTVVGLPYASAARVTRELASVGKVRRAYLGVETVGITPTRAKELGLQTASGVLVGRLIPGSPAAVSSLKGPTGTVKIGGRPIPTGSDAIVAINGTRVREPEDLEAALQELRPGTTARLKVIRGDQSLTISIPLIAR